MTDNPANPYRGVSWHKRDGHYRVKIKSHGRHIHLGYFRDPQDAARHYDAAALLIHGPDAVLNFPDDSIDSSFFRKLADKLHSQGVLRRPDGLG